MAFLEGSSKVLRELMDSKSTNQHYLVFPSFHSGLEPPVSQLSDSLGLLCVGHTVLSGLFKSIVIKYSLARAVTTCMVKKCQITF